MNIRFDSESIRIRVGHQEAVRLVDIQKIYETYPVSGLSLELKTSRESSLSLSFLSPLHLQLVVPEHTLHELLKKVDQPQLKKNDLCIRDTVSVSESRIDLIFEIDCFKLSRKKTP